MSEKIIKAGFTRLLPAEKRPRKAQSDETETDETATLTAEEIQAAYDEIVGAAIRDRDSILSGARMEAVEVALKAGAEAEEIREKAYAQGLEEGRAKGYADFLVSGETVLEEIEEAGQGEVDRAIDEIYAERDRLLAEMEPKILRLALDIGEKILGYELDENKKAFVSMVTAALNVIRCEGRISLRINAAQHKAVFRSKAETLFKTDLGVVEAEIVSDPGVEPGGCVIKTDNGTVDASADAQLEQIARNLGLE